MKKKLNGGLVDYINSSPEPLQKTVEVSNSEPQINNSSTVITFNGKTALRKDCRRIDGKYYKIGDINVKDSGDCFLINDKYYKLSNGKIAWDYTNNRYNIKDNMINGYIPNTKEIMGYFSPTGEPYLTANDGYYIFNKETINILKMKYDFSCGKYGRNVMTEHPVILRNKPTYETLPTNIYSLTDYPRNLVEDIRNENAKFLQKMPASFMDKYLFNYKYGLEIETEGGWFPESLYYQYGCVPLKDGSILGIELTTLPIAETRGRFRYYESLFEKLAKYTLVTQNNSLHVNLSGFKDSPEFRVAFYNLYYRLQQEINAFIPLYKRDLHYLVNKQGGAKDHCKPMEKLDIVKRYSTNKDLYKTEIAEADRVIFQWLNEGIYNNDFNISNRRHRKEGQPKWEWYSRYYAVNLIPLYFGNVDNARIEFRVHSGTINKYKAINWIILCGMIVKYCEHNIEKILCSKEKISLQDIIDFHCDGTDNVYDQFVGDYLKQYIASREQTNTALLFRGAGHNGDNVYGDEFKNDNKYTFILNRDSIFTINE